MMISYAQNYEDVVLDRIFKDRQTGFYVDVGAWDPVKNSTTQHFYRKGWRGINIEPQDEFFQLLRAQRTRDINLHFAIGPGHEPLELITIAEKPACATVVADLGESYRAAGLAATRSFVPQMSLEEILQKHAGNTPIDFLKIDVEGSERSVLESFDLSTWHPNVVLIEATKPHSTIKTTSAWIDLFDAAGYTCALFDGLNCYFAKDPTIVKLLDAPVNTFDRPFITDKWWQVLRPDIQKLLTDEYLMYE